MAISGIGLRPQNRIEPLEPQDKSDVNSQSLPTEELKRIPASNPKTIPDLQANLRKLELNVKFSTTFEQDSPNQLGDLKAGDRISISIGEKDSQADVLRAAYKEFAKKAGLDDPESFALRNVSEDNSIHHLETNKPFTDKEFEDLRKAGSVNIVPQNSDLTALREAKIEELSSYGAFDWAVTAQEERQIVDILKNDPNLSDTIKKLEENDILAIVIERVDSKDTRRDLIDLLGRRLDNETAEKIKHHIERLDVRPDFGRSNSTTNLNESLWQIRFNLARLGITPTSSGFDASKFSDLIGSKKSPFSGVGATGTNPTTVGVPIGDQLDLLLGDSETIKKYSNPLGNLNTYLTSLSQKDRERQAELLLKQPISSTMPDIYGKNLPSRADVIRAAAKKYNLQPEIIAAFLLAEQRDQTKNEDGKDYTAATSIAKGNTSIGLGQVVVSTARRNNLFTDLVSPQTQQSMKQNDFARLLADDTANIFASAKYIRQVANEASKKSPSALPATKRTFPNINFSKFGGNSKQWTDDNIRALGSEYTSRAWDDKLVPAWGNFVYEAYKDVKASGVFK